MKSVRSPRSKPIGFPLGRPRLRRAWRPSSSDRNRPDRRAPERFPIARVCIGASRFRLRRSNSRHAHRRRSHRSCCDWRPCRGVRSSGERNRPPTRGYGSGSRSRWRRRALRTGSRARLRCARSAPASHRA
ncbi:hypothetical protein [Lysobacter gummosus]|uniref:hypothetical protein n=1 Tax=Lysobacter gummosus TaxID=262324 RepID=UPI0036371DAB